MFEMVIDKKKLLRFYGWSEDDSDPDIKACAKKAYADLCRTIAFSISSFDLDTEKYNNIKEEYKNKKETFRNDVDSYIVQRIEELLGKPSEDTNGFDKWHKETCDGILKKAKKVHDAYKMDEAHNVQGVKGLFKTEEKNGEPLFHYGQAQKWLNMTFKNMMIADVHNEEFVKIEKYLHIPIDKFIIDIAKKNNISVEFISNDENQKFRWKSKAWSRWLYEEYKSFQNALKDAFNKEIDEKNGNPLDWEFGAWIEERKRQTDGQITE